MLWTNQITCQAHTSVVSLNVWAAQSIEFANHYVQSWNYKELLKWDREILLTDLLNLTVGDGHFKKMEQIGGKKIFKNVAYLLNHVFIILSFLNNFRASVYNVGSLPVCLSDEACT